MKKRYCERGGVFCKHAYTMDGEAACRLAQGVLGDGEACVKIVRQREKQRVDLWFEENGWQKHILFMHGVSYQKGDDIIIRDAQGVVLNGKRFESENQACDALTAFFPEWLIAKLIKQNKKI